MRKLYIALILACCIVLPLSFFFISSSPEIALMMSKEDMVDGASRVYSSELAKGNQSLHVLKGSFRLLLESGRPGEALEAWLEFTERQPPDAQSQLVLADLYRQLMRSGEYVEALKRSVSIRPSLDALRRLAFFYDKVALPAAEKEILADICDMHESHPDDFLRLARLEAADGDFTGAYAHLQAMKARFPESFSRDVLYLAAALAVENRDRNRQQMLTEVIASARDILRGNDAEARLIELAWFFKEKMEPLAALKVLGSVDGRNRKEVQQLSLALKLAAGKEDDAYEDLKALVMTDAMPDELFEQFIALALPRSSAVAGEAIRRRWLKTGISRDEKRQLAFLVLDRLHNKEWAIRLFKELAQNETPESPDVKEVLFLLGSRPPDEGVKWLEEKANNADLPERTRWMSLYLNALVQSQNKQKLAEELDRLSALEKDPEAIKGLVILAEQNGLSQQVLKLLREFTRLAPSSLWAQKKLGIAAFEGRSFQEAEDSLRRYFTGQGAAGSSDKEDDYLASFDFGELLARKLAKDEARQFFERALAESRAAPEATPRHRLVEAQSLIQLGRREEAIAVLRKIESDGGGKVVRALLANLLIDEKQYEEAKKVLYGGENEKPND